MPLRLPVIVLLLGLSGCGHSTSEAEAILIAKRELQNWQPVPNVADLLLTAKFTGNGTWLVVAQPGPHWNHKTTVGFPLFIEVDKRGNVILRM